MIALYKQLNKLLAISKAKFIWNYEQLFQSLAIKSFNTNISHPPLERLQLTVVTSSEQRLK
jgi:hypothetical protein